MRVVYGNERLLEDDVGAGMTKHRVVGSCRRASEFRLIALLIEHHRNFKESAGKPA